MEESSAQAPSHWIPLFPLPNCVLFPGVLLPLHVFEQRYRKMVRDILAEPNDRRCIAVALLHPGHEHVYETRHAPIYPVVCVGQVVRHEALSDGRYNILVLGCRRAIVTAENRRKPYRRITAFPAGPCHRNDEDESSLLDAVQEVMCRAGRNKVTDACVLEEIVSNAHTLEHLVDSLVYHLIPARECVLKQRVLEEPRVVTRITILQQWLDCRIAHAKSCDRRPWPPPLNVN